METILVSKNLSRKQKLSLDDEDDPPPGEGLSEEIFEVETILEHLEDADNVMFYKVK